jgi:hypothetical protein
LEKLVAIELKERRRGLTTEDDPPRGPVEDRVARGASPGSGE